MSNGRVPDAIEIMAHKDIDPFRIRMHAIWKNSDGSAKIETSPDRALHLTDTLGRIMARDPKNESQKVYPVPGRPELRLYVARLLKLKRDDNHETDRMSSGWVCVRYENFDGSFSDGDLIGTGNVKHNDANAAAATSQAQKTR